MKKNLILSVLLFLCACTQAPTGATSIQNADNTFCRPDQGSSYCLMMKDTNGHDIPLCSTRYSGGGSSMFRFGPIQHDSAIGVCLASYWLDIEDGRYWRGNNEIIYCTGEPEPEKALPDITEVYPAFDRIPRVKGHRVYLKMTYTYVSRTDYERACDKLRRDDFTWDERERRELLSLEPTAVELPDGQYRDKPVWVYFDWPSPVPHLQLTPP